MGELLPQVLEELGLGATSLAMRLRGVWDDALGPQLAPHCRPEGIRSGVILARVRDSGWMQRLHMEKPLILDRLEKALGEPIGRDLRLRVGPIDDPPA